MKKVYLAGGIVAADGNQKNNLHTIAKVLNLFIKLAISFNFNIFHLVFRYYCLI